MREDKKGLEDYAIQGTIITLKHSLSMEKFNFTYIKLGVPITLFLVGRNIVLVNGGYFWEVFPYPNYGEY